MHFIKIEVFNMKAKNTAVAFYRNNVEDCLKETKYYISKDAATIKHKEFKRASISKVRFSLLQRIHKNIFFSV